MPIPTPAPPVNLTLAQKNLWRALHHVADSQLCGVWPDGSTVRGEHLKELVRELESEVEALLLQRAQEIAELQVSNARLLSDWREQDQHLQDICGLCHSDEFVRCGADVIEAVRETIIDYQTRLTDAEAQLTARAQEIEQVKAVLKMFIDAYDGDEIGAGQWPLMDAAKAALSPADAALVSRTPQPEQEKS